MTLTAPAPSLAPSSPDIERLGAFHGARISGVDLVTADDATLAAVRAALVEHKVLFFSGQSLDPDSQVLLGRRLGELTPSHPVVKGIDEDHPEIYALDAADNGFADVWHTDVTFVRRPPLGSILRAVQVPEVGGDTQWADAEAAYRSLSAPVRELADQLTAVHDGTREFGYYLAQRGGTPGTATTTAGWSRSSTRWCGCTRRADDAACSSTRASPRTSRGCRSLRTGACSTSSTRT
jgi:alpha-ketoglutarate-dependent taurine dioxygenase